MAEKITVQLLDDLDQSEAAETIRWGWDGKSLVIDLNKRNADKFRKDVEKYLNASRPDEQFTPAAPRRGRPAGVRVAKVVGSTRAPVGYPAEFTDNRQMFNEWLAEQGEKPARGRVALDKANAFAEAIRGGWSPKAK